MPASSCGGKGDPGDTDAVQFGQWRAVGSEAEVDGPARLLDEHRDLGRVGGPGRVHARRAGTQVATSAPQCLGHPILGRQHALSRPMFE